jgi:hypothetical protein
MKDQGRHRGAVLATSCGCSARVVVGIVDGQTIGEELMLLEWNAVEQRHDRVREVFLQRLDGGGRHQSFGGAR